ncbi:MAG: radical SAM protein [Bacteroidetes bacterium]|nr:MAG: radical SAM protein [Bacteroidota bacterium]
MSRKAQILAGTLTARKLWNFQQIYASYYYSLLRKKAFHRGRPVKIGIEPTTFCNLRCPECPSGLRAFTRPTGMMDMDLYGRILDELSPDLIYLLLYFQGEPYLHKQFLDMAAYARSRGVFSATSTNGHYLTDEKARQTVESGLSEVLISIDGVTQESYESYRVGGKLEKVKEGVQNLVYWRSKLKSLHPHIVIQFLVVKPNEHEIDAILQMGKKLGVDRVALKTAQIYEYAQGSPLIPTLDKYSRYTRQPDGSYRIKNKLKNQCWKLWQGAEITWDGRVLPCCFDKDAQYQMGDLRERSFGEIWRNEAYEAFRNRILQSRKTIDICQNCTEGTKVWG